MPVDDSNPQSSPEPPHAMSARMREALETLGTAARGAQDADELERNALELRHNLAAREKMQAILISTLQSLTVGAVAVGQDGVVIVANPAACQMLGRPLERLAASHIDDVLAGIPGAEELLLTLQGAGPEMRRVAWAAGERNRPPRTLELAAVRALPPYDLHLAGVILVEDKTELCRLEAEARLKSRLTGMGEIAMNLAHEIRNPLGSITLFATALARELTGDESLGALAEQIVSGVKVLEHLVANTLEFARPRRMAMSRVSLAEVLADSLVYLEHPLRQKAIRVLRDEATPAAWIAGDVEQLRQVFLNLMINAIQAMEEGGTLRIELRETPGGWEVALTDDGAGIAPEVLEKIFDPFFTTKDKGSGIGLAIVHTIVMAHRARIAVESQAGVGTTFRVTFPAVMEFGQ